ncbi:hypothetical protein DTL21_03515 [Bremerella cremea]|uniref:DUF885 domain-containing protein n=1 Tax=Blastopirellula marina TaxID=124 RepID=A0A2S8G5U0_9BACT|nr:MULTISPECIES: hypothetical protein [Pirellulaceae]PQO39822.1 hypothetical protein C5Y83_03515 [Blastopirellula marina]RCS51288.1 hypothetical protein DTL21_03515 [Bremerella cremea]
MVPRILLAALVMPLLASSCYAQYYGGPYGYGYGYSSTAAEGAAHGLADVVRSAGSYNLDTSRAAVNVEEARKAYIQNRELAQETWFDMRRRNDAYRAEKRGPAPTSEQIFRINAQRAPSRLNDDQIDPVTGELHWPLLLTSAIYDPYRKVIDKGFETRSQQGSIKSFDKQQDLVKAVDAMYDALKKRIRDYEPQQFVEANRFMEALSYDVRFPSS